MAAVALVVQNTGHAATTNTTAALQAAGHTVTVVSQTALTTHDFTVYDAAVCCRVSATQTVANGIRDYLLAAGIPTVLGVVNEGLAAGTGLTSAATLLGVCGTVELVASYGNSENVVNNTHPITDLFDTGNLQLTLGTNYWGAAEQDANVQGTILTRGLTPLTGKATTWVVEPGAVVDAVTLTAPLVVAGFVYGGQAAYFDPGVVLLHAALSYDPTRTPVTGTTVTFGYTGAEQTWVVPAGVTQVQLDCWGAQGGSHTSGGPGGLGARVSGILPVTAGETLRVYVGGQGVVDSGTASGAAGGGGASDVRQGGATLADRVIVAGGGGGSAYRVQVAATGPGGAGRVPLGEDGTPTPVGSDADVGHGGRQDAGGASAGGSSTAGTLGQGGGGASPTGTGGGWNGGGVGGYFADANGFYAGGGGGLYGGGGGGGSTATDGSMGGGGGGSSYVGGVTDMDAPAGVRTGHGQVQITYDDGGGTPPPTLAAYLGATAVDALKLGAAPVDAVYLGADQIG